jgi:hypothetical protein
MPFQTKVNYKQAPAVEGDFASLNPSVFTIASAEALYAADDNVYVGRFAWLKEGGVYGKKPAGNSRIIFVHRQNNAVIGYGEEASMRIPKGRSVSAYVAGEFWARFSVAVTENTKVFASAADGNPTLTDTDEATGFTARTSAAAGELAKISSWGQ